MDLFKEIRWNLLERQAEEILQLACANDYGNAHGKTVDDGFGDIGDQASGAEKASHQQDQPGHEGGDHQPVKAVCGDDAIDNDDEGAGGPANLKMAAAESRNQEARDDGRDETGRRISARRDGDGEAERDCDHRNGKARQHISR